MANKATATSAKAAQADTSAAEATTAHKSNKIYCYIGPNVRGLIASGAVFRGEREDVLQQNAALIEKYPLAKSLIVPGESLAVARLKVKQPGTGHYANYQKLKRQLLENAQEKVRPEYEKYMKEVGGNA